MGTSCHPAARVLVVISICCLCNFISGSEGDPVDSCPEKVGTCTVGHTGSNTPNIVGCLPCSYNYLTASYFDNHNSLLDSEFHDFLAEKIISNDLCKSSVNNIYKIRLSDLNRYLIGEGSHRHLVSTMRFDRKLDASKLQDDYFCETIIIERLPTGVFADPFELQHLVDQRVFLAAGVFGDTNLELPSALSNRSVVEIHMDVGSNIELKSYETVVQLPLHARYPPLDASGYAQVTIGKPDLFLRCRPKDLQKETCSWAVRSLDSKANNVTWQIPCGDEALTHIVSNVTFLSALTCSLLIVLSAVCFSRNEKIKGS
ncbi:phosphatidylinositol-glycan biosynthesis class X protein [Asparagus officinalis]|uniref:phosphatidylinositol-glycan biosynthesis class X protein n=1 Tax=Asparagus officinalis TaxID=4686 RepID=UPI00098E77FD|nr:phosphatidylinositol-glycan biosynthesis class X protein [Asparagus officinalis]